MKTVIVVLCTFNGEKYIGQQIESIVAQDYKNFRLFIRDDGSADETNNIIKEYRKRYPEIVHILNGGNHLGYPDCFWDALLRCPEADYYAFCDQDDVWDAEKLRIMVDKMENSGFGEDIPLLGIHDYDNCDENLKVISRHKLGSIDELTDRSILFYTFASGFCMIINNKMRQMLDGLNLVGKGMYHDELCIWVAHFMGKIVYVDRCLALYRRHSETVTQYGNGKGILITNWLRKEIIGDDFKAKKRRIRTFIGIYKHICGSEQGFIKEWEYLSGDNNTLLKRLKMFFYPRRLKPSLGGEAALRVMLLFKE